MHATSRSKALMALMAGSFGDHFENLRMIDCPLSVVE